MTTTAKSHVQTHMTKMKCCGEGIKIYLKLNLKIIGDSPRTYPHISNRGGFLGSMTPTCAVKAFSEEVFLSHTMLVL